MALPTLRAVTPTAFLEADTNTPEEEAFAQYVLDLDAKMLEGTVSREQRNEAWSVFADLLESRFGPQSWRVRYLRERPPESNVLVLRTALGFFQAYHVGTTTFGFECIVCAIPTPHHRARML